MYENATIIIQNESSGSPDIALLALIIAGLSASGVVGGLILNVWAKNKENNRKYAEFISKTQSDLNNMLDKFHDAQNTRELHFWMYRYFNRVEEIAYLDIKGKIDSDMSWYFKWWLRDAYQGMLWMDNHQNRNGTFKDIWKYVEDWCRINRITTEGVELPDYIYRFQQLEQNE